MTIVLGIVGTGYLSECFIGPALKRATNTKFVAICSRDMERAKSFAIKYKVERAYDSFDPRLRPITGGNSI